MVRHSVLTRRQWAVAAARSRAMSAFYAQPTRVWLAVDDAGVEHHEVADGEFFCFLVKWLMHQIAIFFLFRKFFYQSNMDLVQLLVHKENLLILGINVVRSGPE